MDNYLPIEVIFNLLCVCRRLRRDSAQAIRRTMYRRGLYYGTHEGLPRFSFWIQLCRSAALLDEQSPPRPTIFVPDWLAMPEPDRFGHLLEAWCTGSTSPHIMRTRQELPRLLLEGGELSQTHLKEIRGLEALGICSEEDLTRFGFLLLNGYSQEDNTRIPSHWEIQGDELHVPYPPDWALLWQLERYLEPIDPGVYALDEKALRKAAQNKVEDVYNSLIWILDQGLQQPPPQTLIKSLEQQPTLKVLPGLVLEFSSTDELSTLRQNASLRRELSKILSPHHVHIDTWDAGRILNRLVRLGILSDKDVQQMVCEPNPSPRPFSASEQAYILSLMLTSDGLGLSLAPPPGLLGKLIASLPITLRASAARKACQVLDQTLPRPAWIPEEELPTIPEPQVIDKIESAIQRGQAIDILYQKAEQYQPEHRHLTPLIVEQRGLRFYLIAYCHTRRANRTFRLDRVKLLPEPPQS